MPGAESLLALSLCIFRVPSRRFLQAPSVVLSRLYSHNILWRSVGNANAAGSRCQCEILRAPPLLASAGQARHRRWFLSPRIFHMRTAAFALFLAWLTLMSMSATRAGTLPEAVGGKALPSLAPMLRNVTPAVVNIASKTRVRERNPFFDDPVFQQFFGLPPEQERTEQSLGSGVVIDARKGYVLTNNHVIAGADQIRVTLQDGRSFDARVLGADPGSDLAVLQIPAQSLRALPVANSSALQVGDFVVAVGDPFGLGQTVTSGIVSALGRNGVGDGYQEFIQTDASINPGNSGGALVNLAGQLVGINTMILSPSGGNVGIGFAIPSDLALDVMHQLLTFGSVRRGSLGIQVQSLDAPLRQALHLPADARGVVVVRVAAGSTAARAGVRVGDVVKAVNGYMVESGLELGNLEGLLPVGRPVRLAVLRAASVLQLVAPLQGPSVADTEGGRFDPRLAGASFSDIPPSQRDQGRYGVAVTRVLSGSPAARAGLRVGDVVVGVDRTGVEGLHGLDQLLARQPRPRLLTLLRNGRGYYLRLP